jgi:hypothetical protein
MIPTPMLLNACHELAASEVGRELAAGDTCLLIKPAILGADGREQQQKDVVNYIKPAIEFAGLRLPEYHPEGLTLADISRDPIRLISEATLVVVDANCYETKGFFKLSPFLYYFLGVCHARANRTVLVSRSTAHLAPGLQGFPHTLTYAEPAEFNRSFKAVVQKILQRDDDRPDNPVQEVERQRTLEEKLQRTRAALDASRAWIHVLEEHLKVANEAPPGPRHPQLEVVSPEESYRPRPSKFHYRPQSRAGQGN